MAWNTYKYIILATAWSVCALLAAEAENFNARTRDATRHSPLALTFTARSALLLHVYILIVDLITCLRCARTKRSCALLSVGRQPFGTNSCHKLSRRSTPFGAKCWRSEESARVSRLFFTPLVRRIIITLSWRIVNFSVCWRQGKSPGWKFATIAWIRVTAERVVKSFSFFAFSRVSAGTGNFTNEILN